MSSNSKTITLAEIVDAIELNGLPKLSTLFLTKEPVAGIHTTDELYGSNFYLDSDVTAGCAIGQAGRNLKIPPVDIWDRLARTYYDRITVSQFIAELNDHTEMTLPEIAEATRQKFDHILNTKFYFVGEES